MRLLQFSFYLFLSLACNAHAQQTVNKLDAPNVVEISPQLITSGQPTAEALASLKERGIEVVIYLAPASVGDAVRDEQLITTKQGITFINLPIQFNHPSAADFDTFAALMNSLGQRKLLVHCQVNMRASTMVFLYRTIYQKVAPQLAYESVTKVWQPNTTWQQFAQDQLRRHKVSFELL